MWCSGSRLINGRHHVVDDREMILKVDNVLIIKSCSFSSACASVCACVYVHMTHVRVHTCLHTFSSSVHVCVCVYVRMNEFMYLIGQGAKLGVCIMHTYICLVVNFDELQLHRSFK